MQSHELKPIHPTKKRKRIGRGGKKGTYSGRGMKGQRARAGNRAQPRVRELLKRYPKLRGHRRSEGKKAIPVNLVVLEKYFAQGETISPSVLAQKKIAGKIKSGAREIKILGKGEITKALIVENCAVSAGAKEKIEKAGGKIL